MEVAPLSGSTRDDHVAIFAETGDGQISLYPTVAVQHRGVNNPSRRDAHIVSANPLHHGLCIATLDQELGERSLVE